MRTTALIALCISSIWNSELASAIQLPDTKARFAAEAIDPVGGGPQVLAAVLARDIPKWRQVVERANVRPTL